MVGIAVARQGHSLVSCPESGVAWSHEEALGSTEHACLQVYISYGQKTSGQLLLSYGLHAGARIEPSRRLPAGAEPGRGRPLLPGKGRLPAPARGGARQRVPAAPGRPAAGAAAVRGIPGRPPKRRC